MYIEREIQQKFAKVRDIYNITALVGARQSGKTTFLKEESKKYKVNYITFDDPDVTFLFEEDIKKFERQYIEGYELSILDEIQYCKDSGSKLKYLADKGRKFWITSSSEVILGKEVLSYLVGRATILKMYPFSLDEFLRAKQQKELTMDILKRIIWEHAVFGGYPKVILTEDIELKKTILKDLYELMILKDVAKVFSINDSKNLELFSRYLAINTGSLVSYDTLSNDLKISFETIKKYLDAFEKSYMIQRVTPFFTNRAKEIVKQPKIYFIDTGLRNIIAKSSEITGSMFENYVFSEIIKAGFIPKYWRTKSKAEVDFIVEKENIVIPIEVKLKANSVESSLRSFIEKYNPEKAIIVTYEGVKFEKYIGKCKVIFTDALNLIKLLTSRN